MFRRLMIRQLLWAPAIALLFAASLAESAELRVDGERFLLDGELFDMWGIRVAGAANSEALTEQLISNLDEYLQYGVNTVTVFYQGCSGGYPNPFSKDGRRIDPATQARMERIITECARRGMVVVVGIFYQRAPFPYEDRGAIREVVRTVTESLKEHRNIIINIANEQNSRNWEDEAKLFDFRDPENIIALCREVKAVDPSRLVGGGGYDNAKNLILGKSPALDVLLWDTDNGNDDVAEIVEDFRNAGMPRKPLVNVELYGGWTRQFKPAGVFPEEARAPHRRDVQAAARDPGLSVFLHNNPWIQGPDREGVMRFDLGGEGTVESPGIRWYFELVREARAGDGKENEAPNSQTLSPVRPAVRGLYLYGDVSDDGRVPSGKAEPFHQMRLNDEGPRGLSGWKTALAEVGVNMDEALDASTALTAQSLAGYRLLVLGSNQRRFDPDEAAAVRAWVDAGGGLIAWSDSAFGGHFRKVGMDNTMGRDSDNDLMNQFGMFFLTDNGGGNYRITRFEADHFLNRHKREKGIAFRGEGVSLVRVSPPAVLLARLDSGGLGGRLKINAVDGELTPETDAALAIAESGKGRVIGVFDRNLFWNAGEGTKISDADNREFAQRLALWAIGAD
ncbi:MAG: DUF4350 domain-containing protein [Terrimicrobiaceae bacterium]|nr:DUF4350 domain-containing protein [Terrimicrobiaceae bacterium]